MLLLLLLLLSHFSRVRLCATPRRQPTRLLCPWDSPGKNTGVGCHFLLQCMKVKSESEVAQSCPTLSDPVDYSLPGSSVHGIFQARVLEWGAIAFSSITDQFSWTLHVLDLRCLLEQQRPMEHTFPCYFPSTQPPALFEQVLHKCERNKWTEKKRCEIEEVIVLMNN